MWHRRPSVDAQTGGRHWSARNRQADDQHHCGRVRLTKRAGGRALEVVRISTVLGSHFMITTEVTNTGRTPTQEIVAHLNMADVDGSVYVDPEDWSSNHSERLSLQPSESRTLSWDLQALNAGRLAVAPYGITVIGQEEPAISPLVSVGVASRSTLIAGGALAFVFPVPLRLGLTAAGVLFRIRRRWSGR